MTAILKVDTIQDTSGNNIINENANTITIGKSGDTVNLAAGATAGFGKVLQVVSSSTSSAVVTTSTSFVDINLSLNITPSATSSNIFLMYTGNNETNGSSGNRLDLQMLRDSTQIADSTFIGTLGSVGIVTACSLSKLDAPSTTSQITYKMQGRSQDGTVMVFNHASDTGTLTAFEIAG